MLWTEAAQYLQRTYETDSAMRLILEDLRNINQKSKEIKDDYCKGLHKAIFRCGKVYSEDEKITLYEDGLPDIIRMVLVRHSKSVDDPGLTFESLSYFARLEE